MTDLEQLLRETRVDWPATPDLAAAVRPRLEARRPPWWRRLSFFAVLAVGAAFAVEPARSAILEVLGFESVRIERREPAATPSPPGAELDLGRAVAIAEASETAGPPAALGRPGAAYVDALDRVSYVYAGGRLLVQLLPGDIGPLIQKTVGQGTRVHDLTVAGDPAYFISGEPHGFAYRRDGVEPVFEEQRLAGNTLLVERSDGLLLWVEGRISQQRAVEIAASVPPRRRP
jgi:hypothetical protein